MERQDEDAPEIRRRARHGPQPLRSGTPPRLQRGAIGAQAIGDDGLRSAMALHRLLDEFQRRGLIPCGGDEEFQHRWRPCPNQRLIGLTKPS